MSAMSTGELVRTEEYSRQVENYLKGNEEFLTVVAQTDLSQDLAWNLLKVRQEIKMGDFSKAIQRLKKAGKKISKDTDHLLQGDYFFLKARCNYLMNEPSREDFLKAAGFYEQLRNWESHGRAQLNALIEYLGQNQWALFLSEWEKVSNSLKSKNLASDHVIFAQLAFLKTRILMSLGQTTEALSIYLQSSEKAFFQKLSTQDQHIFHLYGVEALTYKVQTELAKKVASRIHNPSSTVQETLVFFSWLWDWEQARQVPEVTFRFENLISSLTEKAQFFVELSLYGQCKKLYQDHQVKQWLERPTEEIFNRLSVAAPNPGKQIKLEGSKRNQLLALLHKHPQTSWDLIDQIYGSPENFEERETRKNNLQSLISKINVTSEDRILLDGEFYRLAPAEGKNQKKYFRENSQADLVLKRLRQGPASLEDLAKNILYSHNSQSYMGLADLKKQLQRVIRRMRVAHPDLLVYANDLFSLK